MPNKTLTAPGDTVGKNLLKSGGTYSTVRNSTNATNNGNADNKFTLNAKSGSTFFVRRGILLYDFRQSPVPSGIKITRAQLIINDVIESATQTGGDKVRVAHVFNPKTFGAIKAQDYQFSRFDTSTYTSAQQLNNGADGEIIHLDNRRLLNELQRAINQKTFLHLVIRNELDYQGTTPTGVNRAWFDRPNADDNPLQLRFFYRINNLTRNPGGRGAGGVASSGFGGVDMFCGTNSGFGN